MLVAGLLLYAFFPKEAEANHESVLIIGSESAQNILLCNTQEQAKRLITARQLGGVDAAFAEAKKINGEAEANPCGTVPAILRLVANHGKYASGDGGGVVWLIEVAIIAVPGPMPGTLMRTPPMAQFTWSIHRVVTQEENERHIIQSSYEEA